MRQDNSWTIKGGTKLDFAPFGVVGIVNATPDSFYDGGRYDNPKVALDQAERLIAEGAHVLDIGGESTRPFAEPVSAEEELKRVIPILEGLAAGKYQVPVSVDTYKASVARQVLENGASIINDVSACRFDPQLREVLAEYKPGYVLMHSLARPDKMQVKPSYTNVIDQLLEFFEFHLQELTKAGLPEKNIVLDPGIGFGKLLEHNLTILRKIERFFSLGRPVYIGLSNKSMWQKLLQLDMDERQTATQVATALLATKGVPIHRVHEVKLTVQTLQIVKSMV